MADTNFSLWAHALHNGQIDLHCSNFGGMHFRVSVEPDKARELMARIAEALSKLPRIASADDLRLKEAAIADLKSQTCAHCGCADTYTGPCGYSGCPLDAHL
jgi:hypothetical protein